MMPDAVQPTSDEAAGVAAIALIGPAASVAEVMTPRIQAEEDRVFQLYNTRFTEFSERSRVLEEKLIDVVVDAKSSTETIKRISGQARDAQEVVQKLIEQTNTMQKNVDDTLDKIKRLEAEFAVAHQTIVQTMSESAPLTPDEIAQIRVKATPIPTGTKTEKGLPIALLTYTVEGAGDSAGRILKGIDRALYLLDPRWFHDYQIDRRDPGDGFSYVISVFGLTRVTVKLYLRGTPEPVVFEGSGNMSSVSYLDRKQD